MSINLGIKKNSESVQATLTADDALSLGEALIRATSSTAHFFRLQCFGGATISMARVANLDSYVEKTEKDYIECGYCGNDGWVSAGSHSYICPQCDGTKRIQRGPK